MKLEKVLLLILLCLLLGLLAYYWQLHKMLPGMAMHAPIASDGVALSALLLGLPTQAVLVQRRHR